MLGKLWGKRSSSEARRLGPPDARGLEVVDDDPETAWSLWDNALADQDTRHNTVQPLPDGAPAPMVTTSGRGNASKPDNHKPDFDFDEIPTQPVALEELSSEQRAAQALNVVEQHHPRIAASIRAFWGYNECPEYINKLIMEGDDGAGNARSGFHAQAALALMELANLHEVLFGPMGQQGSGFSRL